MWGWHEGHVETDFDCDFERLHFKEVFSGLGLDAKPSLDEYEKPAAGHNTCFRLQHFDTSLKDPNGEELDLLEQPYIAEGVTHYATGAYYNFGVNSEGGVLRSLQHCLTITYPSSNHWYGSTRPEIRSHTARQLEPRS